MAMIKNFATQFTDIINPRKNNESARNLIRRAHAGSIHPRRKGNGKIGSCYAGLMTPAFTGRLKLEAYWLIFGFGVDRFDRIRHFRIMARPLLYIAHFTSLV